MGYRFRYAPSPTGDLHVGNARTALFNFLLARHHGGTMVVRMEDTDRERSRDIYQHDILEGLRWLGIAWNEGPEIGGPHAPYHQSLRLDHYRRAARTLIDRGHAYPCTCSEADLEAERVAQVAAGEPPRYSGHCRDLPPDRPQARSGSVTLRFKVRPGEVVVEDLVKGDIRFDTALFGDFVLLKSDGFPTYNFAAAVDDAEMAITHVVRGEDHLSNTPRQLLLYEALGLTPPRFAHLPMVLGPDRTKLAKRHGATSVNRYRDLGYLPLAMVNAMARLGWSPPDGDGLLTLDELAADFSLDRVGRAGAIFDLARLRAFNALAIRQLEPAVLAVLVAPFLAGHGGLAATFPWAPEESRPRLLEEAVAMAREGASTLLEVRDELLRFVPAPGPAAMRVEAIDPQALMRFMDYLEDHAGGLDPEELSRWLKAQPATLAIKAKQFYWPIRLALTGQPHGPELARIAALLGPAECRRRIEALQKLVN